MLCFLWKDSRHPAHPAEQPMLDHFLDHLSPGVHPQPHLSHDLLERPILLVAPQLTKCFAISAPMCASALPAKLNPRTLWLPHTSSAPP